MTFLHLYLLFYSRFWLHTDYRAQAKDYITTRYLSLQSFNFIYVAVITSYTAN